MGPGPGEGPRPRARIAELLRQRHRANPVLVVSDEPGANTAIEHFAAGDAQWVVSVRIPPSLDEHFLYATWRRFRAAQHHLVWAAHQLERRTRRLARRARCR